MSFADTSERTRRLVDGYYASYDLATARPGDALTIATIDPNDKKKLEVFSLTKLETPKGAQVLEGWRLAMGMGEVTVKLMLSNDSKGGGPTALHGCVVLREGYKLSVSARVLDGIDEEMRIDQNNVLSTVQSLGTIAMITDHTFDN